MSTTTTATDEDAAAGGGGGAGGCDPLGGDLGLCDCAGCDRELIGENTARVTPRRYWGRRPAVAGRVLDPATGSMRPYCPACLPVFEAKGR